MRMEASWPTFLVKMCKKVFKMRRNVSKIFKKISKICKKIPKSVKKYRKSVKFCGFRKNFTSFSDNIKTVNKNEIFSDIFKFLYFWVIRGRILIALFLCISLLYHNYFVFTVIPVIITGLFYYRTNQLKRKDIQRICELFFDIFSKRSNVPYLRGYTFVDFWKNKNK